MAVNDVQSTNTEVGATSIYQFSVSTKPHTTVYITVDITQNSNYYFDFRSLKVNSAGMALVVSIIVMVTWISVGSCHWLVFSGDNVAGILNDKEFDFQTMEELVVDSSQIKAMNVIIGAVTNTGQS